ncbi:MAG: plasmid recombination protein [Bacilli bacterium]|nr:plasmid recombination protein [Bacilli bacterium]
MNYAIFRSKPIKSTNALAGIGAHDNREKEKYKSNPDIDLTRSHENIELVSCDKKYVEKFYEITAPYKEEWDERMKTERPERKRTFTKMVNDGKNVVADELILTASHNFFNDMSREDITKWGNKCMDFVYKDIGYNNNQIISAIIHMDETTPHLHVVAVPLIKRFDKRSNKERYTLSKKTYIHDKMHLSELQDKYHKRMVDNGYDLLRGESKFGREYIPVNELKKVTRWLNKDLNTRHEKLDNAILQLEDNMKSNKELFLDKEYVKIKKETFESIKDVINETKNVMEVQPKLESAFKKVDGFTSSYKSLQMTTNKLNKEVESLKDDNEKLQKENNSLKDIISNLLQKIKEFFRKILIHGNDYSKDETESNVIDLYLDDSFDQRDVYQISIGTTKEDNLFDIADIPDYYKEYNKNQKDNYYTYDQEDKNKDEDFEL